MPPVLAFLLLTGCGTDEPRMSVPFESTPPPSTEGTADTGTPGVDDLRIEPGAPVSFSEAGGLRDSHAVGVGHGVGWLVGWTAEIPMGGTKSTPLRLVGSELDAVLQAGPSVVEAEGPAMVTLGDDAAVSFTDIVSLRTGTRRILATGQPGPIVWLDAAELPRLPFASDIAPATDGSVWVLWSETAWTLTMQPDDFAAAPDGRYRLAHVGADGQLIGEVEQRWDTAPGGKHPPDVEVMVDGSVVCAVSERPADGAPATVVLRRVEDDARVPVSSPDEDGSRPNMAVDEAGRLAVVWREGLITHLETFVSVYDVDLTLLAGPIPLQPGWTSDRPTVAPHPEGWVVVWERPDPIDSDWTGHRELRMRVLAPDGSAWRSEVARFESDDRRRRPALARNGEGTLLLWEQGPNDDTFVRGALLDIGPD